MEWPKSEPLKRSDIGEPNEEDWSVDSGYLPKSAPKCSKTFPCGEWYCPTMYDCGWCHDWYLPYVEKEQRLLATTLRMKRKRRSRPVDASKKRRKSHGIEQTFISNDLFLFSKKFKTHMARLDIKIKLLNLRRKLIKIGKRRREATKEKWTMEKAAPQEPPVRVTHQKLIARIHDSRGGWIWKATKNGEARAGIG